MESLPKEVRNHDPILALEGGKTGLEQYEIIFSHMTRYLKCGGRAFFEFGYSQAPDIVRLVETSRFTIVGITPDIAGIPRVVELSHGEK